MRKVFPYVVCIKFRYLRAFKQMGNQKYARTELWQEPYPK